MERPRKAHYNLKRQTSILYFSEGDLGEYYIRGGIFWPEEDNGFAILAGQDINDKKVHVFEEYSFLTIDHVFGPDQMIEFHGLAPFFGKCWSKYYGDKFFWNQPEETHKRFRLQVSRSQMVQPKPHFIEAPLSDADSARRLPFDYTRIGRLNMEEGSELHKQLEIAKHDEKAHLPAVFALGRLLAGFERYPFRAYDVEEQASYF